MESYQPCITGSPTPWIHSLSLLPTQTWGQMAFPAMHSPGMYSHVPKFASATYQTTTLTTPKYSYNTVAGISCHSHWHSLSWCDRGGGADSETANPTWSKTRMGKHLQRTLVFSMGHCNRPWTPQTEAKWGTSYDPKALMAVYPGHMETLETTSPPTGNSTRPPKLPTGCNHLVQTKNTTTPGCTRSTLLPTLRNNLRTTCPTTGAMSSARIHILQPASESSQAPSKNEDQWHLKIFPSPPTTQWWSPTPRGSPVDTAPVWVFFVHNRLREIILKTKSFLSPEICLLLGSLGDKNEGTKNINDSQEF